MIGTPTLKRPTIIGQKETNVKKIDTKICNKLIATRFYQLIVSVVLWAIVVCLCRIRDRCELNNILPSHASRI